MRILLVYNHNRSFIKKDINILKKHFDVKTYYHKKDKNISELRRLVKWSDIIYCWFASYHCLPPFFFAKRYKKKKIVVVGGYDACNIKGYGLFSSWKGKILAKHIYKNADKILPVDKSLKTDILLNSKLKISDKIEILPTGYDPKRWYPEGKKSKIVLTVCFVDKNNWWRKGLKTLVETAKLLPDIPFYIVGKIENDMKEKVKKTPENIKFTGWISDKGLLSFYQRAKIYCQLSRYEGLPNALCEAMLCECIPIGTTYCGIPNAIGNTGFYVPYGNAKATAEAIKNALDAPAELGKKARKRIMEKYPPEKREKKLIEIIKSLV